MNQLVNQLVDVSVESPHIYRVIVASVDGFILKLHPKVITIFRLWYQQCYPRPQLGKYCLNLEIYKVRSAIRLTARFHDRAIIFIWLIIIIQGNQIDFNAVKHQFTIKPKCKHKIE